MIPILFANWALCLFAPQVTWEVPKRPYFQGVPFVAHVEINADKDNTEIETWMLEASAFTINGKPLSERRGSANIKLAAGTKLALDIDLAPLLGEGKAFDAKDFKLGYGHQSESVSVAFMVPVAKGTDFMKMAPEELSKFQVFIQTSHGNLRTELWPDVAPGHVRNFLDLAASGFYDGTLFHRVSPSFMIQGGDPNSRTTNRASWGSGEGPRKLAAEFSMKKHVKGVLSMARGPDKDSASCQFFIMHGPAPQLDGNYSAFGQLLDGLDTLEAIVNAPGQKNPDGTIMPREPQKILSMTVVHPPAQKR